MKRFILLIMCILPMATKAQDGAFTELVNKYSTMQHCTTIELSKDMLQSMDVGANIDSLTAISVESSDLIETFKKDVADAIVGYKTLLTVNNSGEMVRILGQTDDKGHIVVLVVVTISNDEGVIVKITGRDISLSDASSLVSL